MVFRREKKRGENTRHVAVEREVIPLHNVADKPGQQFLMTLGYRHMRYFLSSRKPVSTNTFFPPKKSQIFEFMSEFIARSHAGFSDPPITRLSSFVMAVIGDPLHGHRVARMH